MILVGMLMVVTTCLGFVGFFYFAQTGRIRMAGLALVLCLVGSVLAGLSIDAGGSDPRSDPGPEGSGVAGSGGD